MNNMLAGILTILTVTMLVTAFTDWVLSLALFLIISLILGVYGWKKNSDRDRRLDELERKMGKE